MATKANHHFIPQFYLRGFADGSGRQARVFTFDRETASAFTTLVRNVGSRRHFFRVDAKGYDPNFLEDEMAKFESEVAVHLSEVIDAEAFPSDEHFSSIMNLFACLSVRNPTMRQHMERTHAHLAERIMDVALSQEEIWESQMRQMKEAGYAVNDDLTYEDMKDFHFGRRYDINVDQTHLIGLEMKMIEPVLRCSYERKWCFVAAPLGAHFIASDNPAVLAWSNPSEKTIFPPGHGLKDTLAVLPLSSKLLLLGVFEEIPKKMVYVPEQVVSANTLIAKHAEKQIYAKDGSFVLNLRETENVRGVDLPKYFPSAASK